MMDPGPVTLRGATATGEPGETIYTRDRRKVYQVQADGSWKRIKGALAGKLIEDFWKEQDKR